MTEQRYKVLVHHFDSETQAGHRQPLAYTLDAEKTRIQVSCEECNEDIPLIIRERNRRHLWLSKLFILNIVVSVFIGIVVSVVSNIYIGSGSAVLFFALITLLSGEPDEIRIDKSYNNNLDKTGIHKKHTIDQMSPEEAEDWDIEPYLTI